MLEPDLRQRQRHGGKQRLDARRQHQPVSERRLAALDSRRPCRTWNAYAGLSSFGTTSATTDAMSPRLAGSPRYRWMFADSDSTTSGRASSTIRPVANRARGHSDGSGAALEQRRVAVVARAQEPLAQPRAGREAHRRLRQRRGRQAGRVVDARAGDHRVRARAGFEALHPRVELTDQLRVGDRGRQRRHREDGGDACPPCRACAHAWSVSADDGQRVQQAAAALDTATRRTVGRQAQDSRLRARSSAKRRPLAAAPPPPPESRRSGMNASASASGISCSRSACRELRTGRCRFARARSQ